jgi:hypothetical protein
MKDSNLPCVTSLSAYLTDLSWRCCITSISTDRSITRVGQATLWALSLPPGHSQKAQIDDLPVIDLSIYFVGTRVLIGECPGWRFVSKDPSPWQANTIGNERIRELERVDAKMIAVRWFYFRRLQCERSLEGDIQGVYMLRMHLMGMARSCRSSAHLLVWFMVRSLRRLIVHSKGLSMAT